LSLEELMELDHLMKRAPMRFGKRDYEDANFQEKRAPMR
jgi:hypothetical protein